MEEWYSLSEASRKMGKERGYVSAWIRNHPEVMPKEMLRKVGDANLTLISDSGIDLIKSTPRKKEIVRIDTEIAGKSKKETSLKRIERGKLSDNMGNL